ncbi:hypothetical protein LTR53_011240 [Teratosphaeriaceae sp. CCFEE 6253]|nr:hypothetical protein LTR53_011240 [Teratosphaeriaceae sp. CCFEE 6253]
MSSPPLDPVLAIRAKIRETEIDTTKIDKSEAGEAKLEPKIERTKVEDAKVDQAERVYEMSASGHARLQAALNPARVSCERLADRYAQLGLATIGLERELQSVASCDDFNELAVNVRRMTQLAAEVLHFAEQDQGSGIPTCPICKEEMDSEAVGKHATETTICGHEFHSECLQLWLEEHKNCPECRHRIL